MFFPKSKKKLLKEGFTHHCKVWGVPCYVGGLDEEDPLIDTANFIPSWVLDLADAICFTMLDYQNRDNPHYLKGWSIYVGDPL